MGKDRIVTRQDSFDMEKKLSALAAHCRENGTTQVLLVAMAARIQQELVIPPTRDTLRNARGIEVVMRAVEHALRGDPEMDRYVLEKLNHGTSCLNNWMSKSKKPPVMA